MGLRSLRLSGHPIFFRRRDSEFTFHVKPEVLGNENAQYEASAHSVDHCVEEVVPTDGLGEKMPNNLNSSERSDHAEDLLHYKAEMSAPLHFGPFDALLTHFFLVGWHWFSLWQYYFNSVFVEEQKRVLPSA
jgi:hypothetical protein